MHNMPDSKINNYFGPLKQNLPDSPSSSSACSSSFASYKNNNIYKIQKNDENTSTNKLINKLPVNIPSALLTEEELEGGELLNVEEVCKINLLNS
jgi:hypothetical protein